ncbi:DUF6053 domain-containing protein [Lysobacter enzymogenes]
MGGPSGPTLWSQIAAIRTERGNAESPSHIDLRPSATI